jgi:hypothetical protein
VDAMKKIESLLPVLFITIPFCVAAGVIAYGDETQKAYDSISHDDTGVVVAQEVEKRLPLEDSESYVDFARSDVDEGSTQGVLDSEVELPKIVNHSVPFTSQAPLGDWKLPYQEACEEASLMMATHYLLNKGGFTTQSANRELRSLLAFVENEGYAIDITAEETVEVARRYYGDSIEVEAVYDFDVVDIKTILADGGLVIMPFSGRQLPNPHFRAPGPLYHMLVVKGYNDTGFITNDPGTKFGANFTYSYDAIMHANHDWNNGNMNEGKKVMISIRKK